MMVILQGIMSRYGEPSTMFPTECRMALKEWAVTVKALDERGQILLLRKGGIREEGRDFRVLHPEFLLYPSYEHQKRELLKESYHEDLSLVLAQPHPADSITFSHWARLEEAIELSDQEKVDILSPHHIWTEDYAQSRLHWKPRHPLSVMLLRLYRMEQPVTVPYDPAYSGCTSWVELSSSVSLGRLTPVLQEEEFRNKVDQVKGLLGLEPARL